MTHKRKFFKNYYGISFNNLKRTKKTVWEKKMTTRMSVDNFFHSLNAIFLSTSFQFISVVHKIRFLKEQRRNQNIFLNAKTKKQNSVSLSLETKYAYLRQVQKEIRSQADKKANALDCQVSVFLLQKRSFEVFASLLFQFCHLPFRNSAKLKCPADFTMKSNTNNKKINYLSSCSWTHPF